jgi:hypothetical protein
MGACNQKSKHNSDDSFKSAKQFYSINKINSDLIPTNKIDTPLKFEIKLHDFRARGLKENKVHQA